MAASTGVIPSRADAFVVVALWGGVGDVGPVDDWCGVAGFAVALAVSS